MGMTTGHGPQLQTIEAIRADVGATTVRHGRDVGRTAERTTGGTDAPVEATTDLDGGPAGRRRAERTAASRRRAVVTAAETRTTAGDVTTVSTEATTADAGSAT